MTTLSTEPAAPPEVGVATTTLADSDSGSRSESKRDTEVRELYELRYSVSGRVRFLSHLETADTLLSALRRAGVRFALSRGFKPKPVIRVALPRPVGVESWDDIAEVELAEVRDVDSLALALSGSLPAGMSLLGVRRVPRGKSAASRVAGATFRVLFDDIEHRETEALVASFSALTHHTVERTAPRKATRAVDVRQLVGEIRALTPDESNDAAAVRYFARMGERGSVRPDEVVQALSELAGRPLAVRLIVRESIMLNEADGAGRVVEPELVGAGVPAGPALPWGAC